MSEKRKGRPDIFQQNEIENKLRECFIQKMDPKTTAKLTGHDIKTIRKYFKKLMEDLQRSMQQPFLQKAKERRELAVMRFAHQIQTVESQKNDILERIKQIKDKVLKKEDIELHKLLLKYEGMISYLELTKLNVENSLTADVSLDEKVEGLKKKYGEIFK